MWCHLLLAMPLIGLGLFFVLPFSTALLLYLVVVALSLLLYAKIVEAMRTPITTGAEAIVGQIVMTEADGSIHWKGEWWTARPAFPKRRVRIIGVQGLVVQVVPVVDSDSLSLGQEPIHTKST